MIARQPKIVSQNNKLRDTFCGKDYPAAKLEEIKAAKCCPCSSVRPQEMDKCEDEYFKELPPADIRKKLGEQPLLVVRVGAPVERVRK